MASLKATVKRLPFFACACALALGCARTETSTSANPPAPTATQSSLTVNEIKASPDDKVEGLIWERCLSSLDGQPNEYELFSKLPRGLKMLFSTTALEAEVNNGGFHQFFWNPSGEYAGDALEGLKLIGAKTDADLLKRAMAIYERERSRIEARKSKGWSKEEFIASEKESDLDSLDEIFYKKGDDLSKLRIKYIRAHPEEFVEGRSP